jgi:radical SAM protein with 4Fe4S-binding SPASM domain
MTLCMPDYPTNVEKKVYILTSHSSHMWFNGFKKHVNASALACSWLIGRIAGKPFIYGMPVAFGMEISGMCNLRCPECSAGSGSMTRKGGFMSIDLYRKILNELKPFLYNINLYFQGEPMLHPLFFDFLEVSGETQVTVSTNGHFLTEENAEKLALSKLSRIIVSLDGMDQETYSKYRQGGEFRKVKSGIEYLSQSINLTGSPLKLEIQFLVNRHNEKQIPSVRLFARKARAKLTLKSMQIIDNEKFDYWLPEDRRYSRYTQDNGDYKIKNNLSNHCLRLWLNPVITWDGKVVPCCFDKNSDHILGDINSNSFRTIWNGEAYRKFRYSVQTGRKNIEICRNCSSGLYGVRY